MKPLLCRSWKLGVGSWKLGGGSQASQGKIARRLSTSNSQLPASNSQRPSRARGAFSLIEVLVVIGISALLVGLVAGGYRTLGENNRRSSCASNLAQIYRAGRLYADDLGAFPPYNASDPKSGGLWLLWGFDDPSDPSGIKTPERALVARYLRSPRAFHCPSDPDSKLVTDAAGALNKRYLSYQLDDGGFQTYQPARTSNLADPDYARQLLHFHPSGYSLDVRTPSNTVITWCKWHRNSGARPDNVLFYDGSVKRVALQTPACVGTGTKINWRRLPDCRGSEGASGP